MSSSICISYTDVISPYGKGVDALFKGLLSSEDRITKYSAVSGEECPANLYGLVYSDENKEKIRSYFETLFWDALEDTLLNYEFHSKKVGIVMATGMATINDFESKKIKNTKNYSEDIDSIPYAHEFITDLQRKMNFTGPSTVIANACSSTAYAMEQGQNWLKYGSADTVLVIGIESRSVLKLCCPNRLGLLSETGIKPFDVDHNGSVCGEGCGVIVLEKKTTAALHNLPMLADVKGVGLSADGFSTVAPEPSGEQGSYAIQRALHKSNVKPKDLSCIFAHGISIPASDDFENNAMSLAIGDVLTEIPVTSIKGHIGHCIGAAVVMCLIAAVEVLKTKKLPVTLGTSTMKDSYSFNLNTAKVLNLESGPILICAYAFGGNNSALVLESPQDA